VVVFADLLLPSNTSNQGFLPYFVAEIVLAKRPAKERTNCTTIEICYYSGYW